MVTIERLSVQFDVEGESQDQVFATLFTRHIEAWHRQEKERSHRERETAKARNLGGTPAEGDH